MGRPHDLPGSISIHGRIVNFYSQMLLCTASSLLPCLRLPGKPVDAPGSSAGARFVSELQAAEERDCKALLYVYYV